MRTKKKAWPIKITGQGEKTGSVSWEGDRWECDLKTFLPYTKTGPPPLKKANLWAKEVGGDSKSANRVKNKQRGFKKRKNGEKNKISMTLKNRGWGEKKRCPWAPMRVWHRKTVEQRSTLNG